MTETTVVPEDWSATCTIYDIIIHDDNNNHVERLSPTRVRCTWEIQLVRQQDNNMALVRPAPSSRQELDPHFCYRIVTPSESPVLRATFVYEQEELESVEIGCTEYPAPPWPLWARSEWESWLGQKAAGLLRESRMSYVVCDFLEHQALDFFRTPPTTLTAEDCYQNVVICMKYPLPPHEILHQRLEIIRAQQLPNYNRDATTTTTTTESPPYNEMVVPLEQKVRSLIHERYREWITVTCPICFDPIIASHAVEITCGHLYCRECISAYARVVVQEIRSHSTNPFRCPLPSCRHYIKIVGCIKKLIDRDEMDIVHEWYKDLKNPRCDMLTVCPRTKKCGVRGQMRKRSHERATVYCEACGGEWCELCLKRTTDGKHLFECDQYPVLRLCDRYREASDKIKARCQERWPWIREYAVARSVDESAIQWVKDNAAMCPNCRAGIERIEGCFHMRCSYCSVHFCYECGDELFPPYYGTHHCWEEKNVVDDD